MHPSRTLPESAAIGRVYCDSRLPRHSGVPARRGGTGPVRVCVGLYAGALAELLKAQADAGTPGVVAHIPTVRYDGRLPRDKDGNRCQYACFDCPATLLPNMQVSLPVGPGVAGGICDLDGTVFPMRVCLGIPPLARLEVSVRLGRRACVPGV